MASITSFALEDFLREHEWRHDCINLASCDAAAWSMPELISRYPDAANTLACLSMGYPNVDESLSAAIRDVYGVTGVDFLPTNGCADAITLMMHYVKVTRGRGARVCLPSPCFGAFSGLAEMLHLDIAEYSYDHTNCWNVSTTELLSAAEGSDLVVVVTPHNPTGRILSAELLRMTAEIVGRGDGLLLVDEVFLLPQDGPSACGLATNVVTIGGLSKVYGMPGLRLGWIGINEVLLPQLRTLHQYLSLSISSAAACFGAAVLRRAADFSRFRLLDANRAVLSEWETTNRDYLRMTPREGGTVAVCEPSYAGTDEGTLFTMLENAGVLMVPGQRCFGVGRTPWFRLAYGVSTPVLVQGLGRVGEVMRRCCGH